jgi:hypothetical protein
MPGVGAVGTVCNLSFRIYSIDESSSKPRHRIADALVLNDIDAQSNNHERMLQVKRVSQITLLHAPALDEIKASLMRFPRGALNTPA